jgi:hypothetical protein
MVTAATQGLGRRGARELSIDRRSVASLARRQGEHGPALPPILELSQR